MIRVIYRFILSSTLAVAPGALLAQAEDDGATAAADSAESSTEAAINDQALQAYGWMIGQERGLFIGYTETELNQILIGIVRSARMLPAPDNMEQLAPIAEQFVKAKAAAWDEQRNALIESTAADNAKAGADLLADLLSNGEVKKTSSGLHYNIIDEGIGRHPSGNDLVRMKYKGSFIDGTVFDSSGEDGKQHIDTMYRNLISGFQEGLKMVREGGSIKLYVPPELGYGDEPTGDIPPGSTLVFDLELIELNPIDFDIGGAEFSQPN